MENNFTKEPPRELLVNIITHYEPTYSDTGDFVSYDTINGSLNCILYNFGDFVKFISNDQIDEYLLNI